MESNNPLVTTALKIAIDAHDGQYRWDGKTPYISHPLRVADLVTTDDEKIVAYLHDVAEDSEVTLDSLSCTFEPYIIDALEALTHKPGEDYADYIKRVVDNPIAARVKIADLTHNLSDLNPKRDKNRIIKYKLAKMYIESIYFMAH